MVYIGTALIDSDNLMSGVVLEDLVTAVFWLVGCTTFQVSGGKCGRGGNFRDPSV